MTNPYASPTLPGLHARRHAYAARFAAWTVGAYTHAPPLLRGRLSYPGVFHDTDRDAALAAMLPPGSHSRSARRDLLVTRESWNAVRSLVAAAVTGAVQIVVDVGSAVGLAAIALVVHAPPLAN